MKNIYKALASAAIALLAASCVNEMGNDTTDGMFRKYNLSFEGSTKTELSGSGSTRQVKWTDGDEIKYYTKDKQSSASTASVTSDGSSAFVEIPRGRNDDFINAVYGAGSLNASSSTSDCMYVESPAKNSQSYTTFAQAHLCAAFSSDLEDPNLRFHNAVAILKFTSASAISKVIFSGNKGEVITGGSNGDLKITYSGGAISSAPASTGGTSVTVTTAGQESDFYIAILPVNFTEGIIVRGYDASGYLLCERKTSGELNTVNAAGLPIIANLGSLQDWLDNPKPTAVDLGLSVKWASFNLGASTPEGSGDYFSWGETAPKSSYTWSTYAYGQSKNGPFSEYVVDATHGTPDYKTILDLEDDAAHAIWGDAWRMPSKEEVQELRNSCTWTWTTMNGVNGYKVTSSSTGNSIFLPAVGLMSGSKVQNVGTEGDYWSSSLYTAEFCSSWSPYFTSSQFSTGDCYRYFGLPVRAVYGEVVPVTEITLPETLILTMGKTESVTLTASVLPENATYKNLTWVSSDYSVANVDANGNVTAVALGTTTVTVYSSDGSKSAQCKVSVNQQIESITLDKESFDICVGDEPVALVATVLPAENTDKVLNWTSSKTSVATVDSDGRVTAISTGTATITATTRDGSGKNATCTVKVYNHVSSISLNKTELTLYTRQTATLTATISPSTTLDKTVSWSSDNESVATVSQAGVVTAVAPGTAIVTVTTSDGSLSASCEVTVKQYVTSITLNQTSFDMYIGDEPVELTATVLPDNATDKSLTWSSSKSSVATVDENGRVTVVANGTATITATAKDGSGRKASCVIYVYRHVESVSLNQSELSLFTGRSATLTVSIKPSTGTMKNVKWSSSDTSVATVNNSGSVYGVAEGSATIIVTTIDGEKTAECNVVVSQFIEAQSVTLNKTVLEMYIGNPIQLYATILPDNASDKSLTWTSSNNSVATVSSYGAVQAISVGKATITAKANGGNPYSTCEVTVNEYTAVDLGLSVKWATCNVGANAQEDYGSYFAWGEVSTKNRYNESTYKWLSSSGAITKYSVSGWNHNVMDGKKVLEKSDDAATVNWGGSWRMPTQEEWKELKNKCSWTWAKMNGVAGYRVTSNKTGYTDKSIFLPAAGYNTYYDIGGSYIYGAGSLGNYWSSSLYVTDDSSDSEAWGLDFNSDKTAESHGLRKCGLSVRPVTR